MSVSVLIVDDHRLFSTTLRLALRSHGLDAHDVPVTSAKEVLRRAGELPPGLVVLDLDLGADADGSQLHGAGLVSSFHSQGWKVLILTGSADRPAVAAAIAAGAIGAAPKSCSFQHLLSTVLIAASGKPVMSDVERHGWVALHRRCQAEEREMARRLVRLSRREREVLELLAEGNRAAAIAERFVVSMTTIRTQIRAILTKLEVDSQLAAVALVRRPADARWDGSRDAYAR